MFEAFSALEQTDEVLVIDIVSGVASFFVVSLGGVGIGVIYALVTSFMTRFTGHCTVIEPLVVVIMGYMSYLTAEIFHLSGIMA